MASACTAVGLTLPVLCVRADSSDLQVEKNSLNLMKCSNSSTCINSDINKDI